MQFILWRLSKRVEAGLGIVSLAVDTDVDKKSLVL
jgi:hypothetical protein